MQPFPYENVVFSDPELPVIFHLDSLRADRSFNIHWHDSLEVLHFVEGEAEVMSDTVRQKISVGEFAVINSNHIHEVRALTPVCRYYCMLADREFCEQLGAPIGELIFRLRVSDDTAREYFDMIVDEMLTRSAYYKPAVRADLGDFWSICAVTGWKAGPLKAAGRTTGWTWSRRPSGTSSFTWPMT